MLTSAELFAGVGGLGRAVDDVFGSVPEWMSEIDPAPAKVLAHHYPGVVNLGDVREISHPPRVDVLSGGFPCQDVSLAGRRRGMSEGTRSGLWSEFARLIDEIRPGWVVIENVRGLLSADATGGHMEFCPWCVGDLEGQYPLRALGAVLGDLAELGFDAEWTGLRASDIGAPHGRYRIFILAWDRTLADADSGGGWGGTPPPGHRSAARADTPPLRSDSRVDGGPPADPDRSGLESERRGLRLLEFHLDRHHRPGSPSGDMILPTPTAAGSGNTPDNHLRKKPGRQVVTDLGILAEYDLIRTGGRLLPTPEAKLSDSGPDYGRAQRDHGGGGGGDDLTTALFKAGSGWGPYAAAVTRWAEIIGRTAPAPVVTRGRGRPRLNPELTEWMMGWPAGWVTAPEIGLTHREQLRATGNGVVTRQAAAALRHLLARPGVPPLRHAAPRVSDSVKPLSNRWSNP